MSAYLDNDQVPVDRPVEAIPGTYVIDKIEYLTSEL